MNRWEAPGSVLSDRPAHHPREVVWSLLGLAIGVMAGLVPARSGITLWAGAVLWVMALILVLILSANVMGARIAALLGGAFLAVPCFVRASPMAGFLLACAMGAPFLAGGALARAGHIPRLRDRWAYLLTWCGSKRIERRPCRFEAPALGSLIVATASLAAAIAVVKMVPSLGFGWLVRWLFGGIAVLAFAEMTTASLATITAALGLAVPSLMVSPYLSTSVAEFWNRRWNPFTSQKLLRPLFFAPLASRSTPLAVVVTFVVSGAGHTLLAYMFLGRWPIALACGAFFVIQPLFIFAERILKLRRWPPLVRRLWTLMALTLVCPFFVEPALQVVEPSWGAADSIFRPTVCVLAGVVFTAAAVSFASLLARRPAHPE